MTMKDMVANVVKAVFMRPRREAFVCGDCARNAQCGAEPSERCVVRAAQIASDRTRPPKRETFIGW